jgi:hypothetical protein
MQWHLFIYSSWLEAATSVRRRETIGISQPAFTQRYFVPHLTWSSRAQYPAKYSKTQGSENAEHRRDSSRRYPAILASLIGGAQPHCGSRYGTNQDTELEASGGAARCTVWRRAQSAKDGKGLEGVEPQMD